MAPIYHSHFEKASLRLERGARGTCRTSRVCRDVPSGEFTLPVEGARGNRGHFSV